MFVQKVRNDGEVRRDGELKAQAVGLPVRALCGLVAAAILSFGLYLVVVGHAQGRWLVIPMFALVAAPFAAIARFGWRVPVVDPVSSDRFRELADPTRPLTDDDFRSTAAERERDTA